MRDRTPRSAPTQGDLEGHSGRAGSVNQQGLLGGQGGSRPWCIQVTECHQQGRGAESNRKASPPCPGGQKSEMEVWHGWLPRKAPEDGPSCPSGVAGNPWCPWFVDASLQSLPIFM